jgi:hypothetical protein
MTTIRKFLYPGNGVVYMFFFLIFIISQASAQSYKYNRSIKWEPVQEVKISPTDSFRILTFSGNSRKEEEFGRLPVYYERIQLLPLQDSVGLVKLENLVFKQIDSRDLVRVNDLDKISSSFVTSSFISVQRKKPFLNVIVLPIRKNAQTGVFEKLVSFTLKVEIAASSEGQSVKAKNNYTASSVLSSGSWIKLSVVTTGVYKIQANDLKKLDPGFGSTDPHTIRMFGNGGGMLPESNATPRIDDLREISIQVVGEDDGVFNDNDYILFYGQGPNKWFFSSADQLFHHQKNIYSDYSYYFVTYDNGPGKRIGMEQSTSQAPTNFINTFNDYSFYEKDGLNLIKSGREWFDPERFEMTTSRSYSFNFPDIDISSPVNVLASVAARSTSSSTSFSVFVNGQTVSLFNIVVPPTIDDYLAIFAKKNSGEGSFIASSPAIDVNLVYNKVTASIGYLDYLEINSKRHLKISGNQLGFRSVLGTGKNEISEFTLNSPGKSSTIWSVTDPGNINRIDASADGDNLVFRIPTDTLKEFIAFDGNAFFTVQSAVKINNQNLHGTGLCDYIIITHPSFMEAANQLAEFHRRHDNMNVLVTTPEIIYNEFSSGAQDLCGLRDFVKMLYDKADQGKEPKYVLLFGDASYDYKDRLQNNENFIPAYESEESLAPVNTFVTDDFIGLLDINEGENAAGDLDIGVGRLPVRNADEAQAAVNKIKHYSSNDESVKNAWRNDICFVADDEDSNLHMGQAESLTNLIGLSHHEYNIDKIYIDAYHQISTPGGGRYPEVNAAINHCLSKGALIMNYNGHGGEFGWAHERVLEIPDIKSWQNFDQMPVFVTATCEFSRFDDPSWISAGEWVFLNQNGGGIALFTTTRPTYADGNIELARNFYNHAFNRTNGNFPKLGDLIVISKNLTGAGANTRKFVLLGDPGLQLAYPNEQVVTTAINNHSITGIPDTLRALESVVISGEIRDLSGNKIPSFNGTLFSTVYDKTSEITTLANDGGTPYSFPLRKNIIYKGKVEVVNGGFSFSFIVPKDIALQNGVGKISYYARSPETDANGFDENIIVGGYFNGSAIDEEGPSVRLFMNDSTFISGGMTDQNPIMLAFIKDESGINTAGSGIGHDLVATLDNDTRNLVILNDYYTTNLNTYKSGIISYPFFGLSDGLHTLNVKVWDVYNNSSDAAIDFLVVSSAELAIKHLMNFPNPFQNKTTFSFEYNHPNTDLDVLITIYAYNGKLIKTIHQAVNTAGYHANMIEWDGTDDSGSRISSGTYLYRLRIKLQDGQEEKQTAKMVVIR